MQEKLKSGPISRICILAALAISLIILGGCTGPEERQKMYYLGKMFPKVKFYLENGMIKGAGRPFDSYTVEMAQGSFTEPGSTQVLLAVFAHGDRANGFKNINIGVYDPLTDSMATAVKGVKADESEYRIFKGEKRDYVLLVTRQCAPQGGCTADYGLYEAGKEWVEKRGAGLDYRRGATFLKLRDGKVLLYVAKKERPAVVNMWEDNYALARELVWDGQKEAFEAVMPEY